MRKQDVLPIEIRLKTGKHDVLEVTYINDESWSMLTIVFMLCIDASGTSSHQFNASTNVSRIPLDGSDAIYLKGARAT